ncbi:hypothetical protein ACJIZ3_025026 [Penstemon smallii]|uniref:Cytochrome P450 n=1 Tax=Penstemon smallii TaxID=265156 RepID=A0ABD3TUG3_9LAMI
MMFGTFSKLILEEYDEKYDDVIVFSSIITIIIIVVGAAVILNLDRKKKSISSGNGIPGRLGIPFLGETISFLAATKSTKGVYHFVTLRRQRYGKWFKTRILGRTHVFVPSIEGAKMVYSNEFGLFKKELIKSIQDLAGRKSVFVVPKDSHNKIRALLSDTFSMNNVSKFVPKIDHMVSQRLNKMETHGKSFPVLDFTMKLGFDAICDTLLSITDPGLLEQMENDFKAVYNGTLSFPLKIPGTLYYKAVKARQRIIARFKSIIADRRSGKTFSDDFLQSMLQKDSYPIEEKLDDEEIMDNIFTLILSGQSTTATAMMWNVKYLSDNQQVQNILRDEQLQVLRQKPDGALLTYEEVKKMPYGLKVIKETLRMANIVLWFPRVASADCTVDGVEIKKGWYVNVDSTYIHYDPKIHKDPLQFNPSRFDEMQKPYTYMPFSSGPRTCLGLNMAKVIMLVFLHRLTTGYEWSVDDEDPSLLGKGFIPKLRSGFPITLKPLIIN